MYQHRRHMRHIYIYIYIYIESKEVITKTEKIEIGQYTVKLYIPEAADAVFQTGNILITGD